MFGVVASTVIATMSGGAADGAGVAPSEASRALWDSIVFVVFDREDRLALQEGWLAHDVPEGGEGSIVLEIDV